MAANEPAVDERLLADERARAVREALSDLPGQWQRMLQLLMADPPASYAEISSQLGLPIGSRPMSPASTSSPTTPTSRRTRTPGWSFGAARAGATVAGYGAPGKGNTLLNHCGIRSDLLAYIVD